MGFRYLAGTSTLGAADEVVDWFATFQLWMTQIGWTVAAGGGTTNVYFTSLGEGGGMTMLFVHVWRDGGNPNRVRVEVADDIVPTHQTTGDGYVDTGGVQFRFWMSGDMDAIILVFALGGGYRSVYAGKVVPFALTIPDETYQMIATDDASMFIAAILRDAAGVWDQDNNITDHQYFDDARIDRYDGSFTLHGCYYDSGNQIAGQLKHMSGIIEDPAINPEDVINTGRPGATTSWVVLADMVPNRFAIRTGGILPTGVADGAFASDNGVAADHASLWNAIAAFAVGRGWVDRGSPAVAGLVSTRLLSSVGESGLETIFVLYGVRNAAIDELNLHAWDDLPGTNRAVVLAALDSTEFPVNYWISGDADCLMVVIQRAGGYFVLWAGLTAAFPPGLLAPYPGAPLSEYSVVIYSRGTAMAGSNQLRDHAGAYNVVGGVYNEGAGAVNSNPNSFDGTTYLVWPMCFFQGVGIDFEPVGQMKYLFFSSGGGIANLDTITVGGQVYTIFFDAAGGVIVMRTT